MQMSELSARTGVPVATIKYYLREGLLHAGKPTARTRARYDETHVARLRLVRALVDVGGMPLHRVGEVLGILADDDRPLGAALAEVHPQLSPVVPDPPVAQRDRVAEMLRELDWGELADSAHGRALADALNRLDLAGLPIGDERLRTYAAAALDIARAEVRGMPADDRPGAVTYAVIGTVLAEPVILALRRIAHQHLATGMD